jgi:(E)-4-hydroxy-3-methylbut-2-enyl-diphosphate synthase
MPNHRRTTTETQVGNTTIGSNSPIRIQTMTNTPTMDTHATVEQTIRTIQAGSELIRITTQGTKEARNLKNIREELNRSGYNPPIIADIHYNTKAAHAAAITADKIRINPGNLIPPLYNPPPKQYTEKQYREELRNIRDNLSPLLQTCRQNNTAIRIGVNHGSLSPRILSRYGDTTQGIVQSCLEYIHLCERENFTNLIISIKASTPRHMTQSIQQLIDRMDQEYLPYPIHLGVTEAGDAEDGRIKSALGIGTLLHYGIGDTIRISLTEPPENEIPVAQTLLQHIQTTSPKPLPTYTPNPDHPSNPRTPIIITDYSSATRCTIDQNLTPDYIYLGQNQNLTLPPNTHTLTDYLTLDPTQITFQTINTLKQNPRTKIILTSTSLYDQATALHQLRDHQLPNPIIIHLQYSETDPNQLRIKAAADSGHYLLNNLADGLFIQNTTRAIPPETITIIAFQILQAAGSRILTTEYIACPSCGRTQFDLHSTLREIKAATPNLPGIRIAVMGCIVNGPGEMADADYGYVGAGPGRITLYRGKTPVKKNIPQQDAVSELLYLINKQNKP